MKILITGGNSEIAKAIVKHRSQMGDTCIVTGSTVESLKKCEKEYTKDGIPFTGIVFNFNEPTITMNDFDAVILNAASKQRKLKQLHELPDDVLEQAITGDLLGNIKLVKALLPHMINQNFGRIIFVSSLSSQIGTSLYAGYIAAKSGMEGVVRNLAVEYSKYNILSNSIRLGLIKTNRNRAVWKRDSYQKSVSNIVLQKRMGEPSDINPAIDLFLSENLYTTGSALDLAGGLPLPNSSEMA
ncbi:MAG: SDR family oxidoreductase [Bacteriovoracaceae bacterium]